MTTQQSLSTSMVVGLALAILCGSAAASCGAEAAPPAVPRWQPRDFSFTANGAGNNPFQVGVSAAVKGPDGKTFTLPGFYDGNGTWKVRISPTIEGRWSLVTKSDLPALNGKQGAFVCRHNPNPKVHGGLRVDPQHPHHFVYEDGAHISSWATSATGCGRWT